MGVFGTQKLLLSALFLEGRGLGKCMVDIYGWPLTEFRSHMYTYMCGQKNGVEDKDIVIKHFKYHWFCKIEEHEQIV